MSKKRSARQIAALTVGWAILLAGPASADIYPSQPIHFIVPFPAGSGPDSDTRQVAALLGKSLGQQIVVENKPGASGRLGSAQAAKAPPNGYTFLIGTPSLATAPYLYANLPYSPSKDFIPVSLLSLTPFALNVNASVPAQSVREFVALSKDGRSKYANMATYGIGSLSHLAEAWFAMSSGAKLNFVHYATNPPVVDLASGQASAEINAILPAMGMIKSGKIRMLAISGAARNPQYPDVPTFKEAGYPDFSPVAWIGVFAPAGTPPEIVEKVSRALAAIARMPEVVAQRRDVASQSVGSTPSEFATFFAEETDKWRRVIEALNLKLD